MKIALFSDVHANLPALQACLRSIKEQKADAIYCLGDLVGYNIWPNEVINEIRKRHIPTIAGNYDRGVGLGIDDCGCAYTESHEIEMGKISISYTNSIIKPAERNYLKTLPAHINLEFHFNTTRLNLLLVHGSPRKINEYLFEDRDEKSLLRIMEQAKADIMCFGHTHRPYHRIISASYGEEPHYYHAINTGSVGRPRDNDPRGCFVLLTINEQSCMTKKNAVHAEFIRFDYDVEKSAKGVEESILPDEFAKILRRGY